MKTVKTKEEKNWTLPGVKLTHEEFMDGIKKAEKGPFYTIDESKKLLKEWREKRNSK